MVIAWLPGQTHPELTRLWLQTSYFTTTKPTSTAANIKVVSTSDATSHSEPCGYKASCSNPVKSSSLTTGSTPSENSIWREVEKHKSTVAFLRCSSTFDTWNINVWQTCIIDMDNLKRLWCCNRWSSPALLSLTRIFQFDRHMINIAHDTSLSCNCCLA